MESKPRDEGVALLASHINDFWDPRMRRQLFEIIDAGGAGLRPLVMEAAGAIRRPQAEQAA
jgi:formate dehydrogenase subunit delta